MKTELTSVAQCLLATTQLNDSQLAENLLLATASNNDLRGQRGSAHYCSFGFRVNVQSCIGFESFQSHLSFSFLAFVVLVQVLFNFMLNFRFCFSVDCNIMLDPLDTKIR